MERLEKYAPDIFVLVIKESEDSLWIENQKTYKMRSPSLTQTSKPGKKYNGSIISRLI